MVIKTGSCKQKKRKQRITDFSGRNLLFTTKICYLCGSYAKVHGREGGDMGQPARLQQGPDQSYDLLQWHNCMNGQGKSY